MGHLPEWWVLLTAAEKLNCPPWELLDQPYAWYEWALLKAEIEADLAEENRDDD